MKNFKCGVLPSPIDERDFTLSDLSGSVSTKEEYPNENYYKDYDRKIQILDQGETMACTGYASAYALKCLFDSDLMSQWFVYHNRDLKNGQDIPFPGNYPRNVLKHLKDEGCVKLVDYNNPKECPDGIFDLDKLKPSIYEKSKEFTIAAYIRLDGLEDIKKFMHDYPDNSAIIGSMAVYQSVIKTKEDGIIPDCSGELSGLHCIDIVGYRDKYLKFANSIGTNWGENGYGYLNTEDPLLIKELWGIIINKPIDITKKKILYKVQVGAFKNKENALKLGERIIKEVGIGIYVPKVGDFYKVQCGAFSNRAGAEKIKEQLKSKGFIGFIVC